MIKSNPVQCAEEVNEVLVFAAKELYNGFLNDIVSRLFKTRGEGVKKLENRKAILAKAVANVSASCSEKPASQHHRVALRDRLVNLSP